MLRIAIAAIIGLALPSSGQTQEGGSLTGNNLYEFCRAAHDVGQAYCYGFIMGNFDGLKYGAYIPLQLGMEGASNAEINGALELALNICMPPGAETLQVIEVVTGYLEPRPAIRHESARSLIHLALMEAFPCIGRFNE